MEGMADSILEGALAAAKKLGASDVHLKVGLPPIYRIKGDLRTIRDVTPVTREDLLAFTRTLLNEKQREDFEKYHECDLAYSSVDGSRFRVNLFMQRGLPGMVLRLIPPEVPPFEGLGLPDVVLKLADEARGLVLVTGVTGSGKSTTLASMIDHINKTRASHIVTIEDPIEFAFTDKRSVVNQRELGLDTTTFTRALRAALRQDPDVVLVGEMRDLETIEIAMLAAETGHLVLSTLHTTDAVETVNRIIAAFPPHQQNQVRLQLASALRGVISQRLLPAADKKKMVPACEVLVNTARVRELIEDGSRTFEIHQAIAEGRNPYGMISFDQSLTALVQARLVTYDVALKNATNPDDFALIFRGVSGAKSDGWLDVDRSGGGAAHGPRTT
jgi:twitching motility protein PilT